MVAWEGDNARVIASGFMWQDGQATAELEQALAELPEGLTYSLNRGECQDTRRMDLPPRDMPD